MAERSAPSLTLEQYLLALQLVPMELQTAAQLAPSSILEQSLPVDPSLAMQIMLPMELITAVRLMPLPILELYM